MVSDDDHFEDLDKDWKYCMLGSISHQDIELMSHDTDPIGAATTQSVNAHEGNEDTNLNKSSTKCSNAKAKIQFDLLEALDNVLMMTQDYEFSNLGLPSPEATSNFFGDSSIGGVGKG